MIRCDTIEQTIEWDQEKKKNEAQMGNNVHLFKTEMYAYMWAFLRFTKPYINATLFNKHQMQGAETILNMEYVECVWSSHEGTKNTKTNGIYGGTTMISSLSLFLDRSFYRSFSAILFLPSSSF